LRKIDLTRLPQASGVQIGWCDDPSCGPHVVLFDDSDQPYTQFALRDQKALLEFIEQLQSMAYDMATRRGR
jgi:hypothetical protein